MAGPTLEDIVAELMGGGGAEPGTITRETLRQLLAGLGIAVPINTADVQSAAQELLDAQAALANWTGDPGLRAGLESKVQRAQGELVNRAGALWGDQGGSVAQSISEYVTRQVETTEIEQRTSRQYLNVPTPEEFLDRFETALATHIQAQVRAGAVSRQAGLWLLDNPDVLFNDYMAELGARAAKGEQIFKPVGVTGEPQLLGERPGAVETSQTEAESKALEQAQRAAVSAPTGAGAGGAAQAQTTTAQQKTETEEQRRALSQLTQTEQVFARPNLTMVYSLSPLDWLQKQGGGSALELLYQGRRGRRAAEAATALGPPAILPRRVV